MADANPSVLVKNVSHSYSTGPRLGLTRRKAPAVRVLKDVSLVAFPGEAIGVLGVNGSGKSTLLGLIAGNLRPRSGEVLVASDASLLGVSAALQPDLNAWENARLGYLRWEFHPMKWPKWSRMLCSGQRWERQQYAQCERIHPECRRG